MGSNVGLLGPTPNTVSIHQNVDSSAPQQRMCYDVPFSRTTQQTHRSSSYLKIPRTCVLLSFVQKLAYNPQTPTPQGTRRQLVTDWLER